MLGRDGGRVSARHVTTPHTEFHAGRESGGRDDDERGLVGERWRPVTLAGAPREWWAAGAGGECRATRGTAEMGARWMPRRWRPRKDAATQRNAPGRRWQSAIRGSPNGATRPGSHPVTAAMRRAPGELKHLSTRRKREDAPSSGERTGWSRNRGGAGACRRCHRGVERTTWRGRQTPRRCTTRSRTLLEGATAEGESPVGNARGGAVMSLREYRPTRGIGWEAGWTTIQG
jgi:hypothetical protein